MDTPKQTDPRQAYRDDLRRASASSTGYAGYPGAAPAPTSPSDGPSIADLIKQLRDEATALVRQEVALAKTEIGEKASKAGRNAAYLVAGGAVAYAGALLLLIAASFLVSYIIIAAADIDTPQGRAIAYLIGPLVVGTIVTAIGYGLIQKAISAFKHTERFVPNKTVESLQENKQWAQSKI